MENKPSFCYPRVLEYLASLNGKPADVLVNCLVRDFKWLTTSQAKQCVAYYLSIPGNATARAVSSKDEERRIKANLASKKSKAKKKALLAQKGTEVSWKKNQTK